MSRYPGFLFPVPFDVPLVVNWAPARAATVGWDMAKWEVAADWELVEGGCDPSATVLGPTKLQLLFAMELSSRAGLDLTGPRQLACGQGGVTPWLGGNCQICRILRSTFETKPSRSRNDFLVETRKRSPDKDEGAANGHIAVLRKLSSDSL
jgi:hypothetical protein